MKNYGKYDNEIPLKKNKKKNFKKERQKEIAREEEKETKGLAKKMMMTDRFYNEED